MTVTLAPNPWTPSTASPGRRWRFAHEVRRAGAAPVLQWVIRRNCSISPAQLGAVYGSLCLVSLAISAGFWWHGAPAVMLFAGLELLLVGLALLVFARHVGDHETLTLDGPRLEVEQVWGSRNARTSFLAGWVSVEPAAGQGSLVELSGQGQRVRVGRLLRAELRQAFAQELRGAVRRAEAAAPAIEPGHEPK